MFWVRRKWYWGYVWGWFFGSERVLVEVIWGWVGLWMSWIF